MSYHSNPQLAAVNYVLRKIGEHPVTGLEVPYPTVNIALYALEEARNNLLVDEWYFNTFDDFVLEVDTITGTVPVPPGTLQVYPHSRDYVNQGKQIVCAYTGNPVDKPVPAKVVMDIPLGELPLQALYVVQAAAALATYAQDYGADETASTLQEEYLGAYHQLSSQHTRTRRSRTQDRPTWRKHLSKLRL